MDCIHVRKAVLPEPARAHEQNVPWIPSLDNVPMDNVPWIPSLDNVP